MLLSQKGHELEVDPAALHLGLVRASRVVPSPQHAEEEERLDLTSSSPAFVSRVTKSAAPRGCRERAAEERSEHILGPRRGRVSGSVRDAIHPRLLSQPLVHVRSLAGDVRHLGLGAKRRVRALKRREGPPHRLGKDKSHLGHEQHGGSTEGYVDGPSGLPRGVDLLAVGDEPHALERSASEVPVGKVLPPVEILPGVGVERGVVPVVVIVVRHAHARVAPAVSLIARSQPFSSFPYSRVAHSTSLPPPPFLLGDSKHESEAPTETKVVVVVPVVFFAFTASPPTRLFPTPRQGPFPVGARPVIGACQRTARPSLPSPPPTSAVDLPVVLAVVLAVAAAALSPPPPVTPSAAAAEGCARGALNLRVPVAIVRPVRTRRAFAFFLPPGLAVTGRVVR